MPNFGRKNPEEKLAGRPDVISREPTQAQANAGRGKRVDPNAAANALDEMPDYSRNLKLRAREATREPFGRKEKKEDLPWHQRMKISRTPEEEESLRRLKSSFVKEGDTDSFDNGWGRSDYVKVDPGASGRAASEHSGALTAHDLEASVMLKAVPDLKIKAKKATESSKADLGLEQEFLDKLLDMSAVERADLVDDLTRKGFVLLEAGELEEAKQLLDKATKIGVAFQRLREDKHGAPKPKNAGEKQEGEVLTRMQRELFRDDFLRIFKNTNRSRTIGGF